MKIGEIIDKIKEIDVKEIKFKKMHVIGLIVGLVLIFGALPAYNYITSTNGIDFGIINNKPTIKINSVEDLGAEISTLNDSKSARNFRVTFTALENIQNISIECDAYAKNGTALMTMARFLGFSPCNIIVSSEKTFNKE